MTIVCEPEHARDARRIASQEHLVLSTEDLADVSFDKVVYVWGPTSLFSRVASAVNDQGYRLTTRLVAVAPPVHGALWASGLWVKPRQLKAIVAGHAHVRDAELTSMIATLSAMPKRRLCFSLALGGWAQAQEEQMSTGSGLAAFAGSIARPVLDKPAPLAMVVDGASVSGATSLYACSARRGPMGLKFRRDEPGFLTGQEDLGSALSLLPGLSKLASALMAAQVFKRIHVDLTTGYVIDDDSYSAAGAQALTIETGPVFRLGE